jgi:hypothetical protein
MEQLDKALIRSLESFGYTVVEGAEAVISAIEQISDGDMIRHCSGYKVFPDGRKCPGCGDCKI